MSGQRDEGKAGVRSHTDQETGDKQSEDEGKRFKISL